MKPTLEQLSDPTWWDENAPEGAERYRLGVVESLEGFEKRIDGFWCYMSEVTGNWTKLTNFELYDNFRYEVRRPTRKPWVPEVGEWCLNSDGIKAFYVGIDSDGHHIFEYMDGELMRYKHMKYFDPIKSDKEKWVDSALHVEAEMPDSYQPYELLDKLYDAGLAKLPENEA